MELLVQHNDERFHVNWLELLFDLKTHELKVVFKFFKFKMVFKWKRKIYPDSMNDPLINTSELLMLPN